MAQTSVYSLQTQQAFEVLLELILTCSEDENPQIPHLLTWQDEQYQSQGLAIMGYSQNTKRFKWISRQQHWLFISQKLLQAKTLDQIQQQMLKYPLIWIIRAGSDAQRYESTNLQSFTQIERQTTSNGKKKNPHKWPTRLLIAQYQQAMQYKN